MSAHDDEPLPAIGARVVHYVDGDTGTVTAHDTMRTGRPYVVVHWDIDGPNCGHFADELAVLPAASPRTALDAS